MEIIFAPRAQDELLYWKKSGNVKVQKKIQELLSSILKTPYGGVGKPEPLKHHLQGF